MLIYTKLPKWCYNLVIIITCQSKCHLIMYMGLHNEGIMYAKGHRNQHELLLTLTPNSETVLDLNVRV